jgi:hypothetical protein
MLPLPFGLFVRSNHSLPVAPESFVPVPLFAPTHFGSPGQAPTHTYASDYPPSQAAGGKSEAFAGLQTAQLWPAGFGLPNRLEGG